MNSPFYIEGLQICFLQTQIRNIFDFYLIGDEFCLTGTPIFIRDPQILREFCWQKQCKLGLKGTKTVQKEKESLNTKTSTRKKQVEKTQLQTQATFQGKGMMLQRKDPESRRLSQDLRRLTSVKQKD